ncbi:ADP-ribosylation factor-like protein 9 [Thalassophryne amazonica]|uniref:ADP-ribosylation factor-like protein 9 n=1 Tax=Thalassophryne amazonica TaxID=390379 RepID=UPI0014710B7C|nr:ADP-ribosylation factor-like protein 9 [Thalassophryne amazonica]
MSRWKTLGFIGASAAVTGGVAYGVWRFLFSGGDRGEITARPQEEQEPEETVTAVDTPSVESSWTKSCENQILVLGLDGAGKSSLLHCLAYGKLTQDVEPTEGINVFCINTDGTRIEFVEVGGNMELRPYWQKYISKSVMMVFVVDSSDTERFPIAKKLLHELWNYDPVLPVIVLANKQDLPGACSITDMFEVLSLAEAGDQRKIFIISTYTKKGEAELSSGVQDAQDLIMQMICGSN